MLNALVAGLDYYQPAFGPYQFDQVRIIEFPGYANFAQAFANTIPYTENFGFAGDFSDPEKIDYATYITAHELGHQYWGHQIAGAEMQGGTMLVETLAQYSALMVMKKLYGEDQIRRFLKFELDDYLRGRTGEAVEELPLGPCREPAIYPLSQGLARHVPAPGAARRGGGEPGAEERAGALQVQGRALPPRFDVIQALRAEAKTPEQQALITDLFERITSRSQGRRTHGGAPRRRQVGRQRAVEPRSSTRRQGRRKGTRWPSRLRSACFTAEPGPRRLQHQGRHPDGAATDPHGQTGAEVRRPTETDPRRSRSIQFLYRS
jgi:hypothetical protein